MTQIEVIVEEKKRIKYGDPGNYINAAMTNVGQDRVKLVVGWKDAHGGPDVDVPFSLTLEEARGIDVGDRLLLTLAMLPIASSSGQSEGGAYQLNESSEGQNQ